VECEIEVFDIMIGVWYELMAPLDSTKCLLYHDPGYQKVYSL